MDRFNQKHHLRNSPHKNSDMLFEQTAIQKEKNLIGVLNKCLKTEASP